jgi:hypothetical protein
MGVCVCVCVCVFVYMDVCMYIIVTICILCTVIIYSLYFTIILFCNVYNIYRVSQEECAKLRESVPYVKVYRYNTKNPYPKLKGYGDNGQRKVWSSHGST